MPSQPRDGANPKPAAPATAEGDRIAKVLSRSGVASRREAERMIQLGQVAVNGKIIDSPALNVTSRDRITVDGVPLAPPEPARLWLYYKPEGLVTSASDEKGRDTVFDHLPEDMPRVMSVGRLDLNSEGLLLLTNDGELKRRLELPSTGWLRKYRVRVNGNPTDPDLEPLRRGIVVEGERFQPMEVKLDRIQGANAWLTVGLREGRNREIRRAMSAIGLYVNRLIRVSYGPFRLNEMQPGEVSEVRAKVMRDQLGGVLAPDEGDAPQGPRNAARGGKTPGRSGGTPAPRAGAAEKARPALTRLRRSEVGRDAPPVAPMSRVRPARLDDGEARSANTRAAKPAPFKSAVTNKSAATDKSPTAEGRGFSARSASAKPFGARGAEAKGSASKLAGRRDFSETSHAADKGRDRDPGARQERSPKGGKPIAGKTVSGKPVAGKPVSGKPFTAKPRGNGPSSRPPRTRS